MVRARTTAPWLLVLALLTGCGVGGSGGADQDTRLDPAQVDAVAAPDLGSCRALAPDDLAVRVNATRTVDCEERHTAETYAVGPLPAEVEDVAYDDPALAGWAASTCQSGLKEFLGADESLSMRSILTWAWFGPSEEAWDQGARWYRCDAVGGDAQSRTLVTLPASARGLLAQRPERRDKWMACAIGASVDAAPKVPCTREHDWRAVGVIKVGQPETPYPGDTQVEATTKDFCQTFVGGWLGYPDEYDFGYTFFGAAEWAAGNRRSVCWARTTQ